MRSVQVFVLLAATLALVSADWQIVWRDEFDGGNLADRWNFELGCSGWGNNELQCYTNNRAENARQENGVLVIQARREWWGDGVHPDKPFTSTRMTTKANWLYGKIEARMRMPKGKHQWPAFWMMPSASAYGGWPRSGEIDIMEYRGQRWWEIIGTIHYGPAWDNKGQNGYGREFPNDFSQEWHTYAIDWSSQKMIWLLDDQPVHEENLLRNFWPGLYTGNTQPFDRNFFAILNFAVGGNFFGNEPFDPVEADGWAKNTFEIDYVRVYQWQF